MLTGARRSAGVEHHNRSPENVYEEGLPIEPDAYRINVTFQGLDPYNTTTLTYRLRNLSVHSAMPLPILAARAAPE
ncbi:hypothetical protein CSPX01_00637 [Colletotrichum filicis]|nr:hypothetical protein CSPX01_00637 [Colletotrichum filicis]